ncbi:siroheme synthase CysG [Ignatzschineria sp. LJL83]
MDYLPLFHCLKDRPVLIIGGGNIALRKADILCKAGARIQVIAPQIIPNLLQLLNQQQGSYQLRAYQTGDIRNHALVIAATADRALNKIIAHDANESSALINVVDMPDLCNVIFPAIVDRSPLMIAISSGGRAPVLARLIRAKIETIIPNSYGKLAHIASIYREKVKKAFHTLTERRIFWEEVFEGEIAEQVFLNNPEKAEKLLQNKLQQPLSSQGEIYLIGAGPGDPDLLTFRALRLMQQADIILYDRLVSPQIMELCRKDADKIYVGKENTHHLVPQDTINQMLIDLAKQGKRVARLKGGDPFIFGRGGEEIEALTQHQISFQVVPGITAASGCASYAGIPLTHRDHSQSVRFITGHLKQGELTLPWSEYVSSAETLVFYMGLHTLPIITKNLMAHGKPNNTPIAIIENGTMPEQRVVIGELHNIIDKATTEKVKSPSLIIIGEVVSLREQCQWFKTE